jgi:Ca2+-binding EF-hand superfamily protein/tetratricopeptide (TPR) repeat protein
MDPAGANNDLDAMHQLLHIKLKWKLTERELEHIERVFATFDIPASGAISRRLFPYAMKRLRFTDKSKRRGAWASPQVIKEVLNGTYPDFAKGQHDLSYLAYVDAVGRAKDEILNVDDAGRSAATALHRLSMSLGITEEEDTDEYNENKLWEQSVDLVNKRHVANAAEVFQQALKSSTSQVHGPQRILRKDLTPVMCALKPGLSDKDVQTLCEVARITGRNGLSFADVVTLVGFLELAANTLGGINKLLAEQKEGALKAQLAKQRKSGGFLGMLGGAVSDTTAEMEASSAAAQAQFASNAEKASSEFNSGVGGMFSGAQEGFAQGGSFFALNSVNAASMAAAVAAEAEAAAASASNAANAVLANTDGDGDVNKRLLVKQRKAEEAKKAAVLAATEAARHKGEAAMKAAALAAQAEADPVFSKQVIGNWFRAKAGGDASWHSALASVFAHFDENEDGLIGRSQFSDMLDELELDIDDEDAFARFDEVDVDESGEISLDEFERFFEVLIREWRAADVPTDNRIQEQYRPLLTLFEPDDGIFGNNGDGSRKGFLRLMSRNGYVFWSDKPPGEALAAGHWSARLGYDDAREAFELAASLQMGANETSGVAGTRCSRLAMLRFVRMHAPDKLPLSDSDFERLVWLPHVLGGVIGAEKQEMDLASFREFANDSALPRYFQAQIREKRGIKDPVKKGKDGKSGGGDGGKGLFGNLWGSISGNTVEEKPDKQAEEAAWRDAFNAVDLDGSGDLDLEEINLLLTAELNMPLNEDEIHALFLKYDTHMTESIDVEGFIGLMRDANRLLSATAEDRERELLGWGDKNDVKKVKKIEKDESKATQREMSRKTKDEAKTKTQAKLRRAKSKSTYSDNNVDLDQLKREVSSKLQADSYAPITLEEVSDLAHGGGELEGFASTADDSVVVGPPPPGITQVVEEPYETDEGETDDEGGFEEFDANAQAERERSKKMEGEKTAAASGALQTLGVKKTFAEIEQDLDADLMSDLRAIYEKCLKHRDDDGLDVEGFVLAMKELKLDLAEWRIKETFEESDTDGNGSLDFEEFVELAAIKIVEKWAVKGGHSFLADESGAANVIKTNAKRQLTVGEIMGEVMDNKANEEYSAAKARFHVEEILLIEEAFIALAYPASRRGRVKIMKLKEFTILIGINAREHDLAVLAAEADPLDTRTFALPEIIIALSKLQHIWRKVDGQLHDFRSDQETLSDEMLQACNRAFKRSVRQAKFKADSVPLMECRMVPSAFRLLGFVIEPALANLWIMELHLGHEEAEAASNADAIVYEYSQALHEKKAKIAKESHGLVNEVDEEEPEEVRVARLEGAAARKSRRWVSYSDFLNLVGRYMVDMVEVEEDITTVTQTGVMNIEVSTTDTVKKQVPRKKTVQEEEALPPAKRNVSLASCYRLPYDTLMMSMGLYDSVDAETKKGEVAAYHLKIMFRRLSWRIGVKPTAAQIDVLVTDLGFAAGSTRVVTLYDWLFMIEFISSHPKEDNFFGQYARALNKFGYMEEEGGDDGNEEEEDWERPPKEGFSDEAISKVRVQGLDTAKEKVKVHSIKRQNSLKRFDSKLSFDTGDTDGHESKQLDDLTKKANLDEIEKARVVELMVTKKVEEQLAELMAKGLDMTPADKAKVQELMKEQAAAKEARIELEKQAERDEFGSEGGSDDEEAWGEDGDLKDLDKLAKTADTATMFLSKTGDARAMDSSLDRRGLQNDKIKGGLKSKKGVAFDGDDDDDDGNHAWKDEVEAEKDAGPSEEEAESDVSSDEDEVDLEAMRLAATRARVFAESEENRVASLVFEQFSAEGFGGAPIEAAGNIRGQRVLVQALDKCKLNHASDLRIGLLMESFISSLLALPTNTDDVHAGNVLINRENFLRFLEQGRRFVTRQKKVTREDLEPEELFIISDPQGYGFITMKRVRHVVRSMGIDPKRKEVAKELLKLGKESAEDNYVVTYDRFIVFIERLRMDVLGMGLATTLDVDLSKATRMAAKDLKQTRKTMHEKAKAAAEQVGMTYRGKEFNTDISNKDYVASLIALLEQTDAWEAKPAAERERALHLLRVHKVESERRKHESDQATVVLETKINILHDRAMRQTKYAREYALDKLKAEESGVPPTPRAPQRPKEPPLTAKVLDDLNARKRAAEMQAQREKNIERADVEFRKKNNIPDEPDFVPSVGVFDKVGYMKELKQKANNARKVFEHKLRHSPNDREALEQSARQAIRIYSQICSMDPVPSAATYQIGLMHKRLGNDGDALRCFDEVINIDPDGSHGDTGAAWDLKGTMLLASGGKPADAAFCFEQALKLRPTDVLIRKHLKDCEIGAQQALDAMASDDDGGGGGGGKKKKDKGKKSSRKTKAPKIDFDFEGVEGDLGGSSV